MPPGAAWPVYTALPPSAPLPGHPRARVASGSSVIKTRPKFASDGTATVLRTTRRAKGSTMEAPWCYGAKVWVRVAWSGVYAELGRGQANPRSLAGQVIGEPQCEKHPPTNKSWHDEFIIPCTIESTVTHEQSLTGNKQQKLFP